MARQTLLKSALCLLMALVCNVAWAQIDVSTSVETPEHVYRIKSKNGYWMTSCTSLGDETNSSVFAFFDAGDGAYKIYSVERQKWVSYFKTTEYTNSKSRAILVNTQEEANAWKVTTSGEYYLFAPYLVNGNAAGFYWNWFQGIGSNPSNNVTISIGLYNSNSDGGSLWMLSEVTGFDFAQIVDLNGTYTDEAGQAYSCTYKGIQGKTKPVALGGGIATISNEAWNGNAYTANITFPFMPSNAEITNHVVISPYNNFVNKYYASGTDVKSYNGMNTALPTDVKNYLWAFYPTLTDDGFKVKIKNVGTGTYIYSDPATQAHADNDILLKGIDDASLFTITESNRIINEGGKYLSVSSSGAGEKIVGNYHKDHNGTNNKFVAANNYTLTLSDESTYSGTNGVHNVQGGNYTYADGVWNENGYSATVDFNFSTYPFPISEKGGSTNATMISSFSSGTNKWYADGANICAVLNKQPSITNLNAYLWAIYPTLNEGTFTFIIKNIATNKYVYTTSTGNSHNEGTVTLSTEGTSFTFDDNKFKIFKGEKFLSMNSSTAAGVQYVGTWGSHDGCNTTYSVLTDYTVTTDASGYSAIYTPIAVTIPDGVTVYTGTLDASNTILSLNEVSTAIPANTAVIISGAASTIYTFSKHSDEVAAIEGNNLQGAETSVEVTNIEGNVYTFQYSDGTASFAKVTEGSILGHTAYIAVESEGEAILIKEFEKALITANQAKLGEGIGYASYTVNGNKVYTADAVIAAIDAATSADDINAIKESFKYEIPMAGVPYALYDATHNVYLDIHNLGKEKYDASQDKLATLGTSVQPLYITGDTNNGTWKIHTAPEGGNYLHQAVGTRNWNSWVSDEPGDFSWGVEVSTSEGEITYKLKKLTGGYLGTDVSLHKDGEPLYVNAEAAQALNLKLVTLPVLAVNNLDAEGITYPYALPDEQAAKVFSIENLTIAMDVTMGATTSNNEAFICASDISVDSNNETYNNNSTFVAMGTEGEKVRYFASAKSGGWYTANTSQLTASRNHKVVIVMDKAQNIRKVYVDGTAANITNYQDFNHFKDNENARIFIGGGKNSVGDKYVFSGTVHSVQFFNTALAAEEIAAIEYPVTDKQESDALKALIAKTQELVDSCYNYYHTEVDLQTKDANGDYYVSTNAQSTQEEGSNGYIKDLIDNNNGTYFHSDYSGTNSTDGLDHHITIALGNKEINSSFKFKYVTRHNGGSHFPSTIKVYGGFQGAEDIEYEELTTINSGLPTSAGKEYISPAIDVKKQYSHLRFMVTKNSSDEAKGGHQFFHMAEFDLMPRQAKPVRINPTSAILTTTLESTNAAIITAQEEANKPQTAAEYATATEALQAAYEDLVAAIASGNLPVLVSIDTNNPIVYKIGIKRGDTKVLAYDLGATDMVAVEDYMEGNVLQGWYFTLGSTPDQAFIHPYVGGGDVLAAKSTGNSTNAVWAKAKGTYTYQEWTIPVVNSENGTYNIKSAGNNANYFSHNGGFGKTKYMGFYSSNNTTDTGSLFTFERISFDDGIWNHTLTEFVNKVCTEENVPATPQLGYITRNEDYDNAYNNATALIDGDATESELKSAYAALRSEFENLDICKPQAGKFYTIANNGNYITGSTTNDGKIALSTTNDANAIYYFDGSHLLAYSTGLYIGLNGSDWAFEAVGTAANNISTVEFGASTVTAGELSIYCGGRWLHNTGNAYVNRCSNNTCGAAHSWKVVEVTSLPVAISSVGYATLYAPVALEIDANVEAYVVSEIQSSSVLLEQVTGVVPAETGLIIKGNQGEYSFSIGGDATAEITANELKGTVAKSLITPENDTTCYVLAKPAAEKPVGLYKASLNKNEGIAFINNGCKAYLPVKTPAQAAPALAFRFGRGQGTTEIELPTANGQQPTAVYDLQGRRVLNPTKGMYIINGKKVVIR